MNASCLDTVFTHNLLFAYGPLLIPLIALMILSNLFNLVSDKLAITSIKEITRMIIIGNNQIKVVIVISFIIE